MSKEKKPVSDYIKIDGHKPKVKISWVAWKKIKALLGLFDFEFCFLLEMDEPSKQLRIKDIHIIKQTGSAAYTEMKKEALDSFCLDCMSGVRDINIEMIKGWGHSHAKMGTFESGTDVDTSRKEFGDLSSDWSLSLVVNLAGDYYCALHVFKPVASMYLCDLDIEDPETDKETVEIERGKTSTIYTIDEEESGVLKLTPITWDGEATFKEEARLLIAQPVYTPPAYSYPPHYTGSRENGYMYQGSRFDRTSDLPLGDDFNYRDTRNYTRSPKGDDVWDPKLGWVPKETNNIVPLKSTEKDSTKLQTPQRGVRDVNVFKELKEALKSSIGAVKKQLNK